MKVWYNRVNESRRSVVEVGDAEVTIGRDPANSVACKVPWSRGGTPWCGRSTASCTWRTWA